MWPASRPTRAPAILIWRPSRDVSGKPLGLGASLSLGSHGILRFSSLGVISFLRGRLINHDTPPNTSTYPIETKSPPMGNPHYTGRAPRKTTAHFVLSLESPRDLKDSRAEGRGLGAGGAPGDPPEGSTPVRTHLKALLRSQPREGSTPVKE